MTITFENDNDVIVFALEKIISYARRNRQIFVAQCVWWLASILGLEQGLIVHIENLGTRDRQDIQPIENTERDIRPSREVSAIPRDCQEDLRSNIEIGNIHPDRISQVCLIDPDVSEFGLEDKNDSVPDQQSCVLKEAEQFVSKSRKDRKAFNKRKAKDQLSQTRSGKAIAKPLSNKQRKYLQSITKDTIVEYVANRK